MAKTKIPVIKELGKRDFVSLLLSDSTLLLNLFYKYVAMSYTEVQEVE